MARGGDKLPRSPHKSFLGKVRSWKASANDSTESGGLANHSLKACCSSRWELHVVSLVSVRRFGVSVEFRSFSLFLLFYFFFFPSWLISVDLFSKLRRHPIRWIGSKTTIKHSLKVWKEEDKTIFSDLEIFKPLKLGPHLTSFVTSSALII